MGVTTPRIAKVTELHVTCPYCELGHGTVLVEHKDGADQVHGIAREYVRVGVCQPLHGRPSALRPA